MAVSFGMLGILLMLDVCFIVNFFVIRALRKWTDAREQTSRDENASVATNPRQATHQSSRDGRSFEDVTFAWCLGTVRLEPLRVQRFKGWRPLPGQLGIWTTCFFVVLGSTLLSPELMVDEIGVSNGSLDSGLCAFEDFDQGLAELRSRLESMTHLSAAQEQHRLMMEFSEAVVNDTSLYGIPPYDCPKRGALSGHKKDWKLPGPFFPGYCGEALEAALNAAKHRECTQQVCDCPVMPDSVVFKVAGMANEKFCGEVCIDVPYPCPQHSADTIEALEDYRYQQFEAAERRRLQQQQNYRFPTSNVDVIQSQATETVDKILHQVNIASYVYIGYSCLATFFPTPLNLFRPPHWVTVKQLLFGVQKPYFIVSAVAMWWGAEYFRRLWYSPDIRLYLNNLRVGDPCFVNTEYLLERQRLLNELCETLVPLEPEWNTSALTAMDVLREVEHFVDDCECSFPNVHLSEWKEAANITNVTNLGFSELDLCGTDGGVFDHRECTILTLNESSLIYQGNASICTNKTAALKLILEAPAPDHEDRDWYELWVASGFLATLLVKIAVANFGLALMTLADPFVVCAGEFLGLPWSGDETGNSGTMSAVLISKRRSLSIAGLSKTFFWGSLMHACLFNMFASAYEGVGPDTTVEESLNERDKNVLTGCLGFAAGVAAVGAVTITRLHNVTTGKAKRKKHSSDVEATDEEEFEHSGSVVSDKTSDNNFIQNAPNIRDQIQGELQ